MVVTWVHSFTLLIYDKKVAHICANSWIPVHMRTCDHLYFLRGSCQRGKSKECSLGQAQEQRGHCAMVSVGYGVVRLWRVSQILGVFFLV